MGLREKFIHLVQETSHAKGSTRGLVGLAGVAGFFLMAGFLVFSALMADRILRLPEMFCARPVIIAGWAVLLAGGLLCFFSVVYFLKARGTPVPLVPPPKLVTSGPYRYSRNPMLSGFFMALFGLAVVLKSLALMCIFTPLFIVLMVWHIIALEEPELEKRLGDAYLRYCQNVPRFFPCLGQKNKPRD